MLELEAFKIEMKREELGEINKGDKIKKAAEDQVPAEKEEDIQWTKEVLNREPEVSTRHEGAPAGPGTPWWVHYKKIHFRDDTCLS